MKPHERGLGTKSWRNNVGQKTISQVPQSRGLKRRNFCTLRSNFTSKERKRTSRRIPEKPSSRGVPAQAPRVQGEHRARSGRGGDRLESRALCRLPSPGLEKGEGVRAGSQDRGAVYVRYWEAAVASALSWHTCGKVTGTMKGLALRALGKLRGLRPLLHTGGDVQGYMHRVEQFDRTSQSTNAPRARRKC